MIYRFFLHGALEEHEFEAVVEVQPGVKGDYWNPPEGPEIEVACIRVMDGDRSYYRPRIFMVHGDRRRRLLEACLADKVADLIVDSDSDKIIEQASEIDRDNRAMAEEVAYEMRRDR